jgi:hypothetical protein
LEAAAEQYIAPVLLDSLDSVQIVDVEGETLMYLFQGLSQHQHQAAGTAAAAAGTAATTLAAGAANSAATAAFVAATAATAAGTTSIAAAAAAASPMVLLPTDLDSVVPLTVDAVFSLSSRPNAVKKVRPQHMLRM